ncbi:MauE/DoxX family redox-associated membrane protein [Paenibacillus yanchengensis]|uniref:MauE/DoxX family redox-associated membrane protein n=1 Tax=Paenibacillus yanchengensis TaxID=2035833 RepID=A0ABW4YEX7_9BACL
MTTVMFYQICISTVFIVSSIFKMLSILNFQITLEGLGITKKIAWLGSRMLPIYELTVAILLLFQSTKLYGGIGILILLICFIWAAWKDNKNNNSLSFNCFGNLIEEKFGIST